MKGGSIVPRLSMQPKPRSETTGESGRRPNGFFLVIWSRIHTPIVQVFAQFSVNFWNKLISQFAHNQPNKSIPSNRHFQAVNLMSVIRFRFRFKFMYAKVCEVCFGRSCWRYSLNLYNVPPIFIFHFICFNSISIAPICFTFCPKMRHQEVRRRQFDLIQLSQEYV